MIWARCCGIDWDTILCAPAHQIKHRSANRSPVQIPKCQVNRADRMDAQSLTAIVDRSAPHLFPDQCPVRGGLTFDKNRQMLFDQIGRCRAPCADANTDTAVFIFDLNDDRRHR